MKRLLVLATIVAASNAFAGLSLDGRIDHKQTSNAIASGAMVTGNGPGAFALTYARLNYTGTAVEGLTVTGQYDLTSATAGSTASQNGTMINHLFLNHKMGSGSLSMGKLSAVNAGLLNAELINGATNHHSYFSSAAAWKAILFRPIGINYQHYLSETSSASLVIFNNNDGVTTGGNTNGAGYGLSYMGKYGATTVNASYTAINDDTAVANSYGTDSYLQLSGLYKTESWDLGLSYYSMTDAKIATGAGNPDTTLQTITLDFRYKMGNWEFPIRFESSSKSICMFMIAQATLPESPCSSTSYSKDASDTLSQYSLAAEYRPTVGSNNMRYHFAYVNRATTMDTTASTNVNTNMTQVFAGVKYLGDLLK